MRASYARCATARALQKAHHQGKFGLQLRSKELDSGGRAPCKQDHAHGLGIYFGKENNSSRRVILQIELELNNLNSILSRSAVTPVFPYI